MHLEHGAGLSHVVGIQNNVGIGPGNLLAELGIAHGHGALGALGSHHTHAPTQFGRATVHTVLLVDHAAGIAIGHARAVLAESHKRHVGEKAVAVRARAIVQLVRAQPVGHTHARNRGHRHLAGARGHGVEVGGVVFVKLHHPAVRAGQHGHLLPAPVPELGQAQLAAGGVVPPGFLHRPATRLVPCVLQPSG